MALAGSGAGSRVPDCRGRRRPAPPWVVRATEGFTASCPALHRRLLPMNSSMIVTEPLRPMPGTRIGWAGMETLRDGAHAYVYAQRTADGRIAIGGPGRAVPVRVAGRRPRVRPPAATVAPAGGRACGGCFPASATSGGRRTPGAACWAWPATGARPLACRTGARGGRAGLGGGIRRRRGHHVAPGRAARWPT